MFSAAAAKSQSGGGDVLGKKLTAAEDRTIF
jgi:hypothetical protein